MRCAIWNRVGMVVIGVAVLTGAAATAQAGTTFLNKWGSYGTGNGQFNQAIGLAVNAAGQVYVSEFNGRRVQKFDRYGNYLSKWNTYGSGSALNRIQYMAVNADNDLYVCDKDNHYVHKYDCDDNDNWLSKLGGYGTGDGQFNGPGGVAVNAAGDVYVVEYFGNRVQKFNSSGSFLTKWGGYGSGNGKFNCPYGAAVDAAGNVYVTDNNNDRVQKFDGSGTYLTQWGGSGSGNGQFGIPMGVAVSAMDKVYVTDHSPNDRVQKFDTSGNYISQWGSSGTGNGQFASPREVRIATTGEVYVAELGDRVQRFFDSDEWVSGTNEFTNASYGPTDVGVGSGELLGLSQTLTSAKTLIVGGTTTVYSDGTLMLDDGLLISPALDVYGTFGGTGTVIGDVSVKNGGIHAPGTSPGIQTILGDYGLESGSTLEIQIDALASFDQVVADAVAIDGAILDVILGYDPMLGDSFTIIDNLDTGGVTGSLFAGLPEGGAFDVSGPSQTCRFLITYAGGDGNDVMLTAVPEPSTMVLLLGLALVLLIGHRWRRRK